MNVPPSIYFSGDQNKAITLKSKAMKFYQFIINQADIGGVSYVSRTLPLDDGSFIKVTSFKEGNYKLRTGHVTIFGQPFAPPPKPKTYFYMESGFLFHKSITNSNADSHKPSIIRFNDFVTNNTPITTPLPTELINASVMRVVKDEDDSWAVGCSKKVGDLVVQDELGDEHTFTSDPPEFCSADIRKKKYAQLACPPGVFTGKLKLMVQAIYGSLRSDYSVAEPSVGYPHLTLETNELSITLGSGTNTSGLYKDPEGNYWIISIGNGDIGARALSYDETLLDQIEDITDPLKEAYLLSTLVATDRYMVIGNQTLTSFYTPIAYGWKFNKAGDECSIVVYSEYPNLLGISDRDVGIETRLVTVKFGWDLILKQPKVLSSEVIEEGLHAPYYQNSIWTPTYSILGRYLTAITTVIPQEFGTMYDFVAPIYCYYDETDQLVVIRVKNGQETRVASGVDITGNLALGPNVMDAGGPPVDAITPIMVHGYSGKITYNSSGFTINTEDKFTGTWTSYSSSSKQQHNITLDDTQLPSSGSGGDWDNGTSKVRYEYRLAHGSSTPICYYSDSYTTPTMGFKAMMIVPFDDAESVVLVGKESTNATPDYSVRGWCSAGNIWRRDWYEYTYDGQGREIWGELVLVDYLTNPNWSYIYGNGGYDVYYTYFESVGTTHNPSGYTNSNIQNAILYRSSGDPIILYDDYNDQEFSNSAFNDLFSRPWDEAATLSPYNVNTSYSGSARYLLYNLDGIDNWPEDTTTSKSKYFSNPVGWA